MNNSIFPLGCPVKSLAAYLEATGEHAGECLLQDLIPKGNSLSIFTSNDSKAASKPLVKSKYNPELHLTGGLLCIFNYTKNSSEVGGEPSCNFHSETSQYMIGAGSLPAYRPLFFVITRHILPKLAPLIRDIFAKVKTPSQVEKAMDITFTR